MSTTTKLQSYLPDIIANGAIEIDIFERDAEQLDLLAEDRLDLFDQMFVETGTWGLVFWEAFLNLKSDENYSYEKRRALIKERLMAGTMVFTKDRLMEVLNVFDYSVTKVEEIPDQYLVKIHVSNTITTPEEARRLAKYLRRLFPAHIDCKLLTYDETQTDIASLGHIGPVLTNWSGGSNDSVVVLENTLQGAVTKIDNYEKNGLTLVSQNLIADAYPQYVFSDSGAASVASGVDGAANPLSRVFMTCHKAVPGTMTVGKRSLVPSNIDRTMLHTDEDAQKTDVVRYYVGAQADSLKVTSIEITKEIQAPLKRWSFREDRQSAEWVDSNADIINKLHQRTGFSEADYLAYLQANMEYYYDVENPYYQGDEHYYWRLKPDAPPFTGGEYPQHPNELEIAESVCETWYQYFDSNNVALGAKQQYMDLEIETYDQTPGDVWDEAHTYYGDDEKSRYKATQKLVLSDFPENAAYVEVTHVIKRPDATPIAVNSDWQGTNESFSNYLPFGHKDGVDQDANGWDATSCYEDYPATFRFWPKYDSPRNSCLNMLEAQPDSLVYPEGFAALADAIKADTYAEWHIYERYTGKYFPASPELHPYHPPTETAYWDGQVQNEMADYYIEAYSHQESHVITTAVVNMAETTICNAALSPVTVNDPNVYLADISTATGVATFYDLHDLLGLPKVIQDFYNEKPNYLSNIKLIVGDLCQLPEYERSVLFPDYPYADCLNIIVSYGNDYHASGIIGGANTNNVAAYRFDILPGGGLSYVNKKIINSPAILQSGYEEVAVEDAPPFSAELSTDYIEGAVPSLVRKYTSWIDEDFMLNSIAVLGKYNGKNLINPNYLVTMHRKKKYYIYEYHAVGQYAGYLGSYIVPASTTSDFVKFPQIDITNLATMETRQVNNAQALEACRTSAPFHSVSTSGIGLGPAVCNVSESNLYGIPLPFVRCRTPYTSNPKLDGSGIDDSYQMPSLVHTNGAPVVNGLKFRMVVVDPADSFRTSMSYDYAYGNGNTSDVHAISEKLPLCPTDIMPDLTIWMDTAYDYSLPEYPAIQSIPSSPATFRYYPSAQFASLYYPYVEIPEANVEPYSPSILTAGTYYTSLSTSRSLYMANEYLYTTHDQFGTLYAAYNNTALKDGRNNIEGAETAITGVKLARIDKTAFSTYDLFQLPDIN